MDGGGTTQAINPAGLADRAGLEPATNGLTVRCSAIELPIINPSQHTGMGFNTTKLSATPFQLRVVRLPSLAGGLLLVVPVADAPEIAQRVIVTRPDMVNINSDLATDSAGGETNLTLRPITSMHLRPERLPVGRQSLSAGATSPIAHSHLHRREEHSDLGI